MTVTCRPFSSNAIPAAEGVMRNTSSEGSYIETASEFKPGTILILRITRWLCMPSSTVDEEGAWSLRIAEVKWSQPLAEESSTRYGMGVRYLG